MAVRFVGCPQVKENRRRPRDSGFIVVGISEAKGEDRVADAFGKSSQCRYHRTVKRLSYYTGIDLTAGAEVVGAGMVMMMMMMVQLLLLLLLVVVVLLV